MQTPKQVVTAPMSNKRVFYAVAILLVCHFLLIIFTFSDYGMCWDQPGLHKYGQAVMRFYASLGHDTAVRHEVLKIYGGLFEIVSNAVEGFTHLGWLEARNLTSALLGLLGCLGCIPPRSDSVRTDCWTYRGALSHVDANLLRARIYKP
jgi:hypothetical protein